MPASAEHEKHRVIHAESQVRCFFISFRLSFGCNFTQLKLLKEMATKQDKDSPPKEEKKTKKASEMIGHELMKAPPISSAIRADMMRKDMDRRELQRSMREESMVPKDSVLWKLDLDNVVCAGYLREYILCSERVVHSIVCQKETTNYTSCLSNKMGQDQL